MTSSFNEYKNMLVNKMKNDPAITSFLKQNKLDKEEVAKWFNTFADSYRSFELCKGCKGLDDCKQAKKGERYGLSYDGIIMNTIDLCPYLQELRKKQSQINSFVYSDIPDYLCELDMNNIDFPERDLAHLSLFKLCLDVLKGDSVQGLYIYGDLGVGKTYMCIALANSLVKQGKKVAFVKCNSFVNDMRKLVATDSAICDRIIKLMKSADYLFIDDIGSESVSAYSRDDLLFNILDARMENKLTTFFTSNMSKTDLLKHYTFEKNDKAMHLSARRLLERIEILSDDFVLTGKNLRRL